MHDLQAYLDTARAARVEALVAELARVMAERDEAQAMLAVAGKSLSADQTYATGDGVDRDA